MKISTTLNLESVRSQETKPMEIRGEIYEIRYFSYKENVIWGATAMMLNELLEIIKRNNISLRI